MIPPTSPRGKCEAPSEPVPDSLHALTARINELLDRGEGRVFEQVVPFNEALPTPLSSGELLELAASETRKRAVREVRPPVAANNGPSESEYVCLDSPDFRTPSDSLRAAVAGGEGSCGVLEKEEKTQDGNTLDWKTAYELGSRFPRILQRAIERRERSPDWHTPLFAFVYLLRGDDELVSLDPGAAWDLVDGLLRRIGRNPSGDHWTTHLGVGPNDAEVEFRDLWVRIRCPYGENPLQEALRRADAEPTPIGRTNYAQSYIRFVSLCAYAQVTLGAKPIGLPQDVLARPYMLGISQRNVGRYIASTVKDGFMRRVGDPKHFGNSQAHQGRGRCATYLVDLSHWPHLARQAAEGTAEMFRGEGRRKRITAEDIESAYQDLIGPTRLMPGGIQRVKALLADGEDPVRMMTAIKNYQTWNRRKGYEPKFRKWLGNFFGGEEQPWLKYVGGVPG